MSSARRSFSLLTRENFFHEMRKPEPGAGGIAASEKLLDKAMVKHKISVERKRFTMYNIKAAPVSASSSALQAAEGKIQ